MNCIYFDFDGTIADSFLLGIEIANELAPKYGFSPIASDKIEYYRSLSAQELIKELKIPLLKLPVAATVFKKELKKKIDRLLPFEGVPEMLEQLSEKYYLGILTSNSVENVTHFLEKHQLKDYFSDIRSEFQLFGKASSLKKIIHQLKIEKKELVYVGDETRDMEATKRINITSIAVTWGFNSESALKKFNPSFIAKFPNEIVKFCDEYFK